MKDLQKAKVVDICLRKAANGGTWCNEMWVRGVHLAALFQTQTQKDKIILPTPASGGGSLIGNSPCIATSAMPKSPEFSMTNKKREATSGVFSETSNATDANPLAITNTLALLEGLANQASTSNPNTIYIPGTPSPRLPPLDTARSTYQGFHTLSPLVSDLNRVQNCLDMWHMLYKRISGHYSRFLTQGSPEGWKCYNTLLGAANAFLEHDIPPGAWIEWRLEWFKAQKLAYPNPLGILNSAHILKFKGWWRKSYRSSNTITYNQEDSKTILEQIMRRSESIKKWRTGLTGDQLMLGFPVWYVEMRRQENQEDPLVMYPRVTI